MSKRPLDTVNRNALWQCLEIAGYPPKFVSILKQLHEGIESTVICDTEVAEPFLVTTGDESRMCAHAIFV